MKTAIKAKFRLAETPRLSLAANGCSLLLFVFSTMALEANAGFLPGFAAEFKHAWLFRWIASLAFWISVPAAVPLSTAAVRGCRHWKGKIDSRRRWWGYLAWAEVAAWVLAWFAFIDIFWPAITCGLHIYGFPCPAQWPWKILAWIVHARRDLQHWLAVHMF